MRWKLIEKLQTNNLLLDLSQSAPEDSKEVFLFLSYNDQFN